MKIGIITDIHNNYEALNAVLDEFDFCGVEKIICCGDIIGIGPEPEKTVKRIMQLKSKIECVRGNHEEYLISGIPNKVPNDEMMDYEEMEHHKWEHSKLSGDSVSFIKSLPYSKTINIVNKKIYAAHYSMSSENKYINYTPKPSFSDLDYMFKNVKADIILYGHNHNASVNHESDKWYINSGSLGCPVGTLNSANAGVLSIDGDNVSYEQLAVAYNVNKVVDDIKNIKYPDYKNILLYFYGVKN